MTPVLTTVLLRTQSDQRLLALAHDGHERAFAAIDDRYRHQLARALRRFLPAARIDDVVQQTFISAWKAIAKGAEVADLQAWLHRIARNAALADLKRPGYDHAELHDALRISAGPEDVIEQRDVVRRTLQGVAALPERQRAALLAVAVEGRASQDVALELGASDTATRQLVARARASLRAAATAITPAPVLTWALQAGHTAAAGEGLAGTALGAGGATVLLKTGAVVAAIGVAASAPVAIHEHAKAKRDATAAAVVAHRASATNAPGTGASARSAAAGAQGGAGHAARNGAATIISSHRDGRHMRVVGLAATPGSGAAATTTPSVTPTTPPAASTPVASTPAATVPQRHSGLIWPLPARTGSSVSDKQRTQQSRDRHGTRPTWPARTSTTATTPPATTTTTTTTTTSTTATTPPATTTTTGTTTTTATTPPPSTTTTTTTTTTPTSTTSQPASPPDAP
jgi:RNA polymerase sigma factor (sigma-70 family)